MTHDPRNESHRAPSRLLMVHGSTLFARMGDERTRRGDERTRETGERTRLGGNRTRDLRRNPSGRFVAGGAPKPAPMPGFRRGARCSWRVRAQCWCRPWAEAPNQPDSTLTAASCSAIIPIVTACVSGRSAKAIAECGPLWTWSTLALPSASGSTPGGRRDGARASRSRTDAARPGWRRQPAARRRCPGRQGSAPIGSSGQGCLG